MVISKAPLHGLFLLSPASQATGVFPPTVMAFFHESEASPFVHIQIRKDILQHVG